MRKASFENYQLDLARMGRFKSISEFEFVKDPKKNKVQLGVGSFGEVKLAMHKLTQMKYAIKIMNLKNMNSMQEVHGIEREVRVHSTLQHDNIIEYFDSFQENEMVYIVLGYASNGNLYSHLFKKKVFSEKEAYKYFSQTCQAIKYLHSINIVHRDLKPENILLDEGFNIKVCDFGWCTEDIENPRRTFCGTYEYMAPEIVFRQQYDYRIDVWALGVLVYELLHGSAPFKGKNFQEIQRKIEKGDVKFSDTISDQSKHLICKVLQANPLKRISIDDILNHPWMQRMMVLAENAGSNENNNQQDPPNSKVLAKKNESCNLNQGGGKDITNNDSKNKNNNNNNIREVNQIKSSNQTGQGGVVISQESSDALSENKKSSQHAKSLSTVTPIKLTGGSQSKIAGLSSSPYLTQTPQQLNFLSSPSSTPYAYKYTQQASSTTNAFNPPMPLSIGISIDNQNTPIQPLQQSKHNNPYSSGSSISKNAQNTSYLENFKSSGKKPSSQSKSLSTLPISLETIFKGVTANNNNNILGNNTNNAINFPGNLQPLSEKSLNTFQHSIQPQQSPTNHCNYNYNSINPPPAPSTTIAALSINLNSQFNNPNTGSSVNSNSNKIHSFQNLEPAAYSQDIDENSIQSSMKTINTSKFVNRQLPLFSTAMSNTNSNANPSQNSSLKPQSTNASQSQPNFFISGQQALQAVRQLVLKQKPENSQNQDDLLKQQQLQYQQNLAYQSQHQPQQQQTLNGLANQLSSRTIRERSINQSNRNYQNNNNITSNNDQQPPSLQYLQTSEMLDLDQVRPRIKSANTTSNHVSFLARQQQPTLQQNQQDRNYDQSQYNTNQTSNQVISLRSSCNKPFQAQTNNNSINRNNNNNAQYSFNRMNSRSGTSDSLVNFTPIISSIPTKSITLIEQPSSISALAAARKTLETSFHSNNNNNNNHNENPTNSPKNNRSFNQDLILQTLSTLPSQSRYASKTQPSQSQYASKTQPAFYPIQQLDQSHQNNQQILSSQQSSPCNKYPQGSTNYLNTYKVNVNTLKADETRVKDAINNSSISSSNNNSMLRSCKKSSQRSRTLIFQPLNNSKTNSVLHSIDQMIFQVKNALPMEREDNNDGSFYQQQVLLSQHQQAQHQSINSTIQRKNTENQFYNQQDRYLYQHNQRELTTEPNQGHYSTQGQAQQQQLPPATASSTLAQYSQQFQFPLNSQNIQDYCNTQGLEQLSIGGSTPTEQGQYSQQLQQSQNQNSQRVQRSITGKTKLKIFDCREKTTSASFHTQSQRITQYHTANNNNNNNNNTYSNNEGNINMTTASQRLLSLANITVNNYFPQLTNSNNNNNLPNNCSNNQKASPFQPMKQPPTLNLNAFNSNICELQQQQQPQQFLQSSNNIYSNNRVLF